MTCASSRRTHHEIRATDRQWGPALDSAPPADLADALRRFNRKERFLLRLVHYPLHGLTDAVWSLRHRMTTYDANFVALAETLRCPLVTSDSTLARTAHRHVEVQVELFSPN